MGRIPRRQARLWDTSRLRFDTVTWDNYHVPRKPPELAEGAIPVARAIHAALMRSSYNVTSAALAAGLGRTYVRDIFKGRSRNPKTEELQKLAAVLDFEVPASPDPGVPAGDQVKGEPSNHLSEMAIMGMWGLISDQGRWSVFLEAWRALSPVDQETVMRRIIEVAGELTVPPARREGDNV